jgi:hypothetical protein
MPSIRIIRLKNRAVAFQPDIPGSQPGDPLEVDRGEGVTWNNRTNQPHWPWPVDAQGNLLSEADAFARALYLCDRIPAGQVSVPICDVNPDFSPQPPPPEPPQPPNVPPPTINYVCRLHLAERGRIVIRNP